MTGNRSRSRKAERFEEVPAVIDVKSTGENSYAVTVEQGGSRSEHTVTLGANYYRKLTGGRITPEERIRSRFGPGQAN
jgi:hypothetical protein